MKIGLPSGIGDFYLEKAITDPRTKCLIWIGAQSKSHRCNYPVLYRPKQVRVTRLLMKTPQGLEACHRCNRTLCVNQGHLYNAEHKQNMGDAARDGLIPNRQGDASPRALLSEDLVRQLRADKPYWPRGQQARIARMLGVSKSTVSKAVLGKNWGSL